MSSRSPPNTPPSRVWKNAFFTPTHAEPAVRRQPGMVEKTPVCPLKVHRSDCLVTKREGGGGGGGSCSVHPLARKSWKSGASPGQTVDDFNSWPTTRVGDWHSHKTSPTSVSNFSRRRSRSSHVASARQLHLHC